MEQCAFGVCIADNDGVMILINRNSSVLNWIESNRKSTSRVKTMARKELHSKAFHVYDDSKKLNLIATIMRGINNGDTLVAVRRKKNRRPEGRITLWTAE